MIYYGVQSVQQQIHDSQLAYVNKECKNFGDGNNNLLIHLKSTLLNRTHVNTISNITFYMVGIFSAIILFIQINEYYFYEQSRFTKIYKKSLIAQKIRLNN
jgi:hypothetical protein